MKTTFREKIVVFWMIFCIFAALKVKTNKVLDLKNIHYESIKKNIVKVIGEKSNDMKKVVVE